MPWSGRKIKGPTTRIEQPQMSAPIVGDPYTYNTDKLGIGAMEREKQRDRETKAANRELGRMHGQLVSFSNLGPLPDYRMKAFTGALHDAGGKVKMEGDGLPQSQILAPATGQDNSAAFGMPSWVGGGDIAAAYAALKRSGKVRT